MKHLKSQSGQFLLEALLMMFIFLAAVMIVSNAFRSNEFFANLVTSPWQSLSGLIQNGAWGTPDQTYALHPNHHDNHVSLEGVFQ